MTFSRIGNNLKDGHILYFRFIVVEYANNLSYLSDLVCTRFWDAVGW
jgi:hypothetical protein